MSYSLVLPNDRDVTLVVFAAILPAVQQELRQFDILIALTFAFDFIHKSAEPYQRDFHGLVAVVPFLFWGRADIVVPAICKFLSCII